MMAAPRSRHLLSLVAVCTLVPAWTGSPEAFDYCAALKALCLGAQPKYVAVVSHQEGETSKWATKLPLPYIVYSYAQPGAVYSVRSNHGGPSSAFVTFIVDHYRCLPRWTLFLHGSGGGWHSLDPSTSSALIDLNALDRGFLALGHMSSSTGGAPPLSILIPWGVSSWARRSC